MIILGRQRPKMVVEWLFSVSFLASLLVVLLITFCWYSFGYKPYLYLRDQPIPGPKPTPFLGNLGLFMKFADDSASFYTNLLKTYGNTSRIFLGTKPFIVTVEPELIRQVTITHFDNFSSRIGNNASIIPIEYEGKSYKGVASAVGEVWKRRRNILTPAFSGLKMKQMEPLIKDSTLRLAAKIAEFADNGEKVEVLNLYNKLTMEVILSTVFGRAVDVQNGKGGELYENAKAVFRGFTKGGTYLRILGILAFGFPFLNPLLVSLARWSKTSRAMNFIAKASVGLIEKRRKQGDSSQQKDLLQLMIDACDDETKATLSTGEIVADAVTFLLAGYETTSNFLTYASYLLAINPDVQEKLSEEIISYLEENQNCTMYDAVQDLKYLDMVFKEVFRLYPPGSRLVRVCTKSCVIDKIFFKKGTFVLTPIYHLHRDPKIWEDPEEFKPERFSSENSADRHACSFLPFGSGPRNCIGMRLATLEAKMALVEILTKFRILKTPELKVPLPVRVDGLLHPKCDVLLKFEHRNE